MTINKFQGKTKEEAIEKAKKAFGEHAVILNVKEVKPKGFLKIFKKSTYEVTAAMEEKEAYVNPMKALQAPQKLHENINYAADEKIDLSASTPIIAPLSKPELVKKEETLEKRIDNLSTMLEEKLGSSIREVTEPKENPTSEELNFVRILYNTLLANEVNEKYINQLLDEVEKFIRPGNSVDMILSIIYQKLVLKFGQPKAIDGNGVKPKVYFFVGPTGVGKTTTIAKIASKFKVEQNKKVAFITADTYRIAATEQLKVYANILDAPLIIVYTADEMNAAIAKLSDYDMIFVDTAGFSHKNDAHRAEMKLLISNEEEEYDREVCLVLSATTKYHDLIDIVDKYNEITNYKLIFTKLDETTLYGNILNIKMYSGASLSYVTNGQNVPDDIELFGTQKIVKQLLGGR